MQARTDLTQLKAAAGYTRRSTDRQEQSLDDQRRAIEVYAEQHGFEVVEWFTDDAISGTSTEARKAFQSMMRIPRHRDHGFHGIAIACSTPW